jgi:predicted Mrr-cat superfamily restriction endonuclease
VSAWLIRTGEGGYALPACVVNDVVALRYETVPDARTTPHEEMVAALSRTGRRTDNEGVIRMLEDFVEKVSVGDLIVTPHAASRQVYLGRISGDYDYRDPSPVDGYLHLRPAKWLGNLDRDTDLPADLLREIDRPPTLYPLTNADWWESRAQTFDPSAGVTPPPASTAPARNGTGRTTPAGPEKVTCPTCHVQKAPQHLTETGCVDCD